MTNTSSQVYLRASVLLLLLSGCSSSSGDENSGASRTDAGALDGSTGPQPNELADGAVSGAAEGGKGGGHAAAHSGSGGQAAGGAGARSAESTAGAGGEKTDEPVAGAGGSGGTDHAPPSAGAGGSADDADAGPARDPNEICTSCGACEQSVPIVSTMHTTQPVNYPDPPPTSGPHNPCWATWGVHDQPLPPERWVHNLEHGGVVFLYNCPDGCTSEVDTIKSIAAPHARTIVTAYDKLPKRFGVVSWGHRLVSDCLDEQAFTAFFAAHFDRAPESNSSGPDPSCPP